MIGDDSTNAAKVLLMGPMPPPVHGQAVMVKALADCSKSWHRISLIALDAKFADDHDDVLKVSFKKIWRLIRYLACLCKNSLGGARIVVLTPGFYRKAFLKDSIFIWAARVMRLKVICWFHMDYATHSSSLESCWFKGYFKSTLGGCERFFCVTEAMVNTLPKFLPSSKIRHIPNGIRDIGKNLPLKKNQTSERFVVLYISNMVVTKGWGVLLEAACKICLEFPFVEFEFYGAPQFDQTAEELNKFFKDSSCPERIRYHGFANDEKKLAAMAVADLFCFPSFTEALPLTLLEAMSCGLPIVASNVGGIPDLVTEGVGGWLVPAQDSEALANALRKAIAYRTNLPAMGESNRNRFLERYSLQSFSERWESSLVEVAEKPVRVGEI